ncbi:hypothetical protein HD596_007354 [Nonomuraea jabiensis]|uniref:FAD-binding FR-type domain-containing protein n=1 Tax=Nonomuraea jabiensis TaxID=882448 RepID=A0A7W9LEE4_9ACTN|nr:hypothetical protein [Nonomuraea jabiensis]
MTEDQYVIVHKYLFGAIAEVLGDAVTPAVAAAWDEVYWLMAGALIAVEARLYADAGARPGDTWRRWRVVERREETADAMSLVLRPVGAAPAPPARPGQYVSVRVRMPDGVRQLRQYTLSGHGTDGLRRIMVKRVGEGEVSGLLHATAKEGDELTPVRAVRRRGARRRRGPARARLGGHRLHPDHRDAGAPGPHRRHPPGPGAARRPFPGRPRPALAVHAGGARRAHRGRGRAARHPLRGVRP